MSVWHHDCHAGEACRWAARKPRQRGVKRARTESDRDKSGSVCAEDEVTGLWPDVAQGLEQASLQSERRIHDNVHMIKCIARSRVFWCVQRSVQLNCMVQVIWDWVHQLQLEMQLRHGHAGMCAMCPVWGGGGEEGQAVLQRSQAVELHGCR